MLKEFKEFISKGNVMDLAIGVIIGAAFSDIVTALTNNVIKPLINGIGGAEVAGKIEIYGGQFIDYGSFITAVINFLIVAFVLFLIVKAVNTAEKKGAEKLSKLGKKIKKGKNGEEVEVVEEVQPKDPQLELLEEIRDLLKNDVRRK